jgi:hypothetical protein
VSATAAVNRRTPSVALELADSITAPGDPSTFDNTQAPLRGSSVSPVAAWLDNH